MGAILGTYWESSANVNSRNRADMTLHSPGRWFVAHQMKLLLAYIALNYDIQPIERRPLNRIFGDSILPPTSATMTVKRREAT